MDYILAPNYNDKKLLAQSVRSSQRLRTWKELQQKYTLLESSKENK